MTPSSWASSDVLKSRLHAAQHGVGTTHWPHEFHPTVDPARVPASWAPRVPLTANQRTLVDGGGVQRTWLWFLIAMTIACLAAVSMTAMSNLGTNL